MQFKINRMAIKIPMIDIAIIMKAHSLNDLFWKKNLTLNTRAMHTHNDNGDNGSVNGSIVKMYLETQQVELMHFYAVATKKWYLTFSHIDVELENLFCRSYLFSLLQNYGRALLLLWGHLWDVPWPLAGLVPAHQLTAGWAVRSPMGCPMTSGLTGAVPTAGWWDGSSDVRSPMGCSMTSAWSGVGPPADCWKGLSFMPHVWCPITYGWTGASPLVGCWVGPFCCEVTCGMSHDLLLDCRSNSWEGLSVVKSTLVIFYNIWLALWWSNSQMLEESLCCKVTYGVFFDLWQYFCQSIWQYCCQLSLSAIWRKGPSFCKSVGWWKTPSIDETFASISRAVCILYPISTFWTTGMDFLLLGIHLWIVSAPNQWLGALFSGYDVTLCPIKLSNLTFISISSGCWAGSFVSLPSHAGVPTTTSTTS